MRARGSVDSNSGKWDLYALFTTPGKEEEAASFLRERVLKQSLDNQMQDTLRKERVFVPSVSLWKKTHGQEITVRIPLLPGWLLLYTADRTDLLRRMLNTGYLSLYGEMEGSVYSDQNGVMQVSDRAFSLDGSGASVKRKSNTPGLRSGGGRTDPGKELPDYTALGPQFLKKIDPEESGDLLRLFGITMPLTNGMDQKNFFQLSMSRAVRLVRKGSKPGKRGRNDTFLQIYEGPLAGMGRMIERVNAHKRTAQISLLFMGRIQKVLVPLEIVKVIEVDGNQIDRLLENEQTPVPVL